jgi:hypothetical protein
MKRHPTNRKNLAPKQADISFRLLDLNASEKLILTVRKHFATSYPNEMRAGCPAPGLILAARADEAPSDSLRDHLFQCSECFNEYSEAIRNWRQRTGPTKTAGNWRTKLKDALSRWRAPLSATIAASLLLTANIIIQLKLKERRQQIESPQLSYTRSQPAPVASAVNPPAPAPPALNIRRDSDSELRKPRHVESLAINLDLNRYKALGDTMRGGSIRDEERKIELPPRRALLKLRLRKGSDAGRYRVSVVDPNSNRLIETIVHSRNGKSLSAVLDLGRAARSAHRLRIERGDDLNEYLIEIAHH